jgi:hypothetical protein
MAENQITETSGSDRLLAFASGTFASDNPNNVMACGHRLLRNFPGPVRLSGRMRCVPLPQDSLRELGKGEPNG